MRHAICYISQNENMDLLEIEELLEYCRDKNSALDIKGLLLYSEGNFFQILEGDKKLVLGLFEKIRQDPRHDDLIQVIGRDIEQGSYDGYKVDVLKDNNKHKDDLPGEYIQALKGLEFEVRQSLERMLENFIATR